LSFDVTPRLIIVQGFHRLQDRPTVRHIHAFRCAARSKTTNDKQQREKR